MRVYTFLFISLLCLGGCVQQTLHHHANALMPQSSATSKEMHGVVMTVKGCSVSVSRVAKCHFTVTSKHQDRALNLSGGLNTKIQDDTGISYNTRIAFGNDPTDKTQRSSTLIADTPYDFTMMSENISTQATKVRAITIFRMDVTGAGKIGYLKLNFAHPPMLESHSKSEITVSQTSHPKGVETTHGIEPAPSENMPYQYLFATIKPINKHVAVGASIKALWGNGAYLYLNPNGTLGHNWSKPGPYIYAPGQQWIIKDHSLTIVFEPNVSYTFDIREQGSPLVTYLDQGGIFEMTAHKKAKQQK